MVEWHRQEKWEDHWNNKTPSFLKRCALSYSLRSKLADVMHTMFGYEQVDRFPHNECYFGRQDKDNSDEGSLCNILKRFNVFSPAVYPTCPSSIATKDLTTDDIQDSLVNA